MSPANDTVLYIAIKCAQRYVVQYPEVTHYLSYRLVGFCRADKVHTCLKFCPLAGETLQAATYLHTLFENGYIVPISLQDISARQTPKSGTYDDDFRHFALFGLLVLHTPLYSIVAYVMCVPLTYPRMT